MTADWPEQASDTLLLTRHQASTSHQHNKIAFTPGVVLQPEPRVKLATCRSALAAEQTATQDCLRLPDGIDGDIVHRHRRALQAFELADGSQRSSPGQLLLQRPSAALALLPHSVVMFTAAAVAGAIGMGP